MVKGRALWHHFIALIRLISQACPGGDRGGPFRVGVGDRDRPGTLLSGQGQNSCQWGQAHRDSCAQLRLCRQPGDLTGYPPVAPSSGASSAKQTWPLRKGPFSLRLARPSARRLGGSRRPRTVTKAGALTVRSGGCCGWFACRRVACESVELSPDAQ